MKSLLVHFQLKIANSIVKDQQIHKFLFLDDFTFPLLKTAIFHYLLPLHQKLPVQSPLNLRNILFCQLINFNEIGKSIIVISFHDLLSLPKTSILKFKHLHKPIQTVPNPTISWFKHCNKLFNKFLFFYPHLSNSKNNLLHFDTNLLISQVVISWTKVRYKCSVWLLLKKIYLWYQLHQIHRWPFLEDYRVYMIFSIQCKTITLKFDISYGEPLQKNIGAWIRPHDWIPCHCPPQKSQCFSSDIQHKVHIASNIVEDAQKLAEKKGLERCSFSEVDVQNSASLKPLV